MYGEGGGESIKPPLNHRVPPEPFAALVPLRRTSPLLSCDFTMEKSSLASVDKGSDINEKGGSVDVVRSIHSSVCPG